MKKIMVILSVFVSFCLYGQVDYTTEIQTIFNANCISCHINGGSYYGGLDLETYNNLGVSHFYLSLHLIIGLVVK